MAEAITVQNWSKYIAKDQDHSWFASTAYECRSVELYTLHAIVYKYYTIVYAFCIAVKFILDAVGRILKKLSTA